jgi:hypothetical protein
MTHRIIITGKPATLSMQLAAIQCTGLFGGGPRIEPLPITSEAGWDGRRS